MFKLLTIVREGTPDKGMIITDKLRYIEYITYASTKTKMKGRQYNTYNYVLLLEYRKIQRRTIFNFMFNFIKFVTPTVNSA